MPSKKKRLGYQSPHNVNLWKIPLLLSLAAAGFFYITYRIDVLDNAGIIHLPLWLHFGGIDDCRALLGALMGAVSTVLALIFSVALLVLSMVATLFGPRLLYRFIQDPVTQVTIGLFMATFVHILLTFLVEQQEGDKLFVPQLTIMCCWMLSLVSFSALVYYSHRVATSIQNPDMIARIVDDFEAVTRTGPEADPTGRSGEYLCRHSGYFQEIHQEAIVRSASAAGAEVELLYRPGNFLLSGEPLARVTPPEKLPDLLPCLNASLKLGRHRILQQDYEFGLFQIVEIAIRALSPAVNDTFTGVACIDWLGDALLVLLARPCASDRILGPDGAVRLRLRPVRFARLARAAFDQIRQASVGNPAITIRLLDTVGRLGSRVTTEEDRLVLLQIADATRDAARTGQLVELDTNDVEAAWHRARARLRADVRL